MPRISLLRQLHALILRDLREALVNPVVGAYALIVIVIVAALIAFLGTDMGEVNYITGSLGLCSAVVAGTTTLTTFVFAKDWDDGTLPPMMRTGVDARAFVMARMAASLLLTGLTVAACLAVMDVLLPELSAADLAPLALSCIPAAVFASASVFATMLALRSQTHIYTSCTAALVVYFASIMYPIAFAPVLELLPLGFPVSLLGALCFDIQPAMGWHAILIAQGLWLIAALAALAYGTRSLHQALGELL